MKIHHIGYCCANIKEAISYVRKIYKVKKIGTIIFDEIQKAYLCLIKINDDYNIELVSGKPVVHLLKQNVALYHICYAVENIDFAIEHFKNLGATQVSGLCRAKLFHNKKIVFLQTKLGLIELIEIRNCKCKQEVKSRIILGATFAIDSIYSSLTNLVEAINFPYTVVSLPYNQLYQKLLNHDSKLTRNKGINVILLGLADLPKKNNRIDDAYLEGLINALVKSAGNSQADYLVGICLNNLMNVVENSYDQEIQYIQKRLSEVNNIYMFNHNEVLEKYKIHKFLDPYSDSVGHIPYLEHFDFALSAMLLRKIYGIRHNNYKVIVVDCDNTLWNGVCGEDEISSIVIDKTNHLLQRTLLTLYNKGFILCICSKNYENDVRQIFLNHPDMIISLEHITAWRVNWQSKYKNTLDLSQLLNLPLSSFIFIDDNPIECNEIINRLPAVLTIELPKKYEIAKDKIDGLWAFEKNNNLTTGQERRQWYVNHIKREEVKHAVPSLKEFISSLQLKILFQRARQPDLSRVSELTYRTTQFNFSNKQYTENEILSFLKKGRQVEVVRLSDKYGDYGIIGIIVFAIADNNIFVDSFIISCRALGRGVEHEMIKFLIKEAKKNGVNIITFCCRKTVRNTAAMNFINFIAKFIHKRHDGCDYYQISINDIDKLKFSFAQLEDGNEEISVSINNNIAFDSSMISYISEKFSTIKNLYQLVNKGYFDDDYKIDTSDLRKSLMIIWQRVLDKENLTESANFFEVGGSSLLALRLIANIYRNLSVELKLHDVFKKPVFSDMLNYIIMKRYGHNNQMSVNNLLPKISRVKVENFCRLAPEQQNLWVIDKLFSGSWFNNIPVAYTIKGRLKIAALEKAFAIILKRQPALRAFVVYDNYQPMLQFCNDYSFQLKVIDVSKLKPDQIMALVRDIEFKLFDIYQYPLFRFQLLKVSKTHHILIMTRHHLVFDGWSEGVLNRMLKGLYNSYSNDIDINDIKLEYNYNDYVDWVLKLPSMPIYDKYLSYWRHKLQGFKKLKFPLNFSRSEKPTHVGKYLYFIIPSDIFNSLKKITTEYNTSLFVLLYTAFVMLLYRYSKQGDILIGAPASGRILKNFEAIIGNFVNTLILRVSGFRQQNIAELITKCHKVVLEAYENQFVFLQDMVKNLLKREDLGVNPLYQIMFALQDAKDQKLSLDDLHVEYFHRGYEAARVDIAFELNIIENSLDGGIYYNVDLFNMEFIDELIKAYLVILKDIINFPSKQISEVCLINKSDFFSSDCCHDFCKINEELIHKYFEKQVILHSNKIAIKCGKRQITYYQLNCLSNRLANYLLSKNIVAGDFVALCFKRSDDIIISILACWKIAAVYIPIDANYPREYIEYILRDSSPKLFLTNDNKISLKVKGLVTMVIRLDEIKDNLVLFPDKNLTIQIPASSIAYIIYTSGTTGDPKGVKIKHHSIINLIYGLKPIYHLSSEDRGLLFHSYAFDFSVWEIWSMLLVGGCLVILTEEEVYLPAKFWSVIVNRQITVLNQTPTVFENMVLNGDVASIKEGLKLRLIIFGGEALYPECITTWTKIYGYQKPELYNMYGITETTVHVTYQKIDREIIKIGKNIIGYPIPGLEIMLCDEFMKQVLPGEVGEICISGTGLAEGYLNQEELTAKHFVKFNDKRWYKSGDLARCLANGALEFVGRIDEQIKLRGYRIDLDGVKAKLIQKADVYKACVWVEKHEGYNRLAALIIPDISAALPVIRFLQLVKEFPCLVNKFYRLPNKMRILQHNKPETILQYKEIFIDNEYIKNGIIVKDGDVIIDVGANIGMFSLFIGCHFRNVKLYAIEPIPEIFEILAKNLWLYNIDAKCFNFALSKYNEEAEFSYYPYVSVFSGKSPNIDEIYLLISNTLKKMNLSVGQESANFESLIQAKLTKKIIKSKFKPLSEVIINEDIDRVDLLKIDAERDELSVLQGIDEKHWYMIKQIVVEVHDFADNFYKCIELLKSRGFKVNCDQANILSNSKIFSLYASKSIPKVISPLNFNPIYKYSDSDIFLDELKQFIRAKLPDYMVPARWILAHKIPVTASGKIDFQELKKINNNLLGDITGSEVALNNPIQLELLSMLKMLLDINSCSITDNFFDLGVDSLLLVKMHGYIQDKIAQNVSILDLFSHPNINSLAEFLEEKNKEDKNFE